MSTLSGLKALVVEDESVIAFMIEDMLREIGCEIVASAASLRSACKAARTAAIDFAVLDVNLRGEYAFPAAEILCERRIPFVFSTGYGSIGLPTEFAKQPVLAKPFTVEDLRAALAKLLTEKG